MNSFVQEKCAGVSIALCTDCFGKLLTRRSNRHLFRRLFCGEKACHKTINYKAAIYRGVRSILGIGVSKLELSRKFNAVLLNKVQQEVGQAVLWCVLVSYSVQSVSRGASFALRIIFGAEYCKFRCSSNACRC